VGVMRFTRELLLGLAVFAFALVVDAVLQSSTVRDVVIRLCSLGLFAVSLNLLVGYTGLLSFGQAMFFGVGAYAFTLLMQSGKVGIPTAFLITVLIGAASGLIIGAVCVRLTHVAFAFLTLAVQMMFYSLLVAWSGLTGGEQGLIGGLPKPAFLGIDLTRPTHFYAFNVAVFIVCLLILRRIVLSPFGAALRMIRDNADRALFLGIPVGRYKLAAFVISSMFACVAGILMALFVSGAFPNFAYWTMSGEGLFMIMLGGSQTFLGPVLGALIMTILDGIVIATTRHHGLVIGMVILVAVLGLRRGILDVAWERIGRRGGRKQ
jgi:branched-chain amino acid transport system permease protein